MSSKPLKFNWKIVLLILGWLISGYTYDFMPNDHLHKLAQEIEKKDIRELRRTELQLEELYRRQPNNVEIIGLLGRLKMRLKDWGAAKDWFDKIFEFEPQSKLAHYYLGICDREDGIAKVPIRFFLWRNARKHFEKVIDQDSLFKDVFLQYALLKRYQEDYDESIDLCLQQIALKPVENALKEIFWLYDAFVANGGISSLNPLKGGSQYVEKWLKSRESPYDRLFLADYWRREKQFHSADSLLRLLLAEHPPMPRIPIYLSLVRLHFVRGSDSIAEKYYWQAVNRMQNLVDFSFLFEDMHYILSDQEFELTHNNVADARYFCRTFWRKKNPLPAAPMNVRLAEHYRRLVFAEKNYRFDGFRLLANDPDRLGVHRYPQVFRHNRILNDRGLIYIRFGPPDETATSLAKSDVLNESWLYYPREKSPKLIFHFEVHGGPGCWRLTPILSSIRAYEDRLGWDTKMNEYYLADNLLARYQYESELKLKSRNNVAWATEHEFHTWGEEMEPLDMALHVSRFLGDSTTYLAEVAISLPKSSLFDSKTKSRSLILENAAAVFDKGWHPIANFLDERRLHKDSSHQFYANNYIRKFRFEFDTPQIRGSSHARDKKEDRLNGFKFELDFSDLNSDSLVTSDIELAYRIMPSTANNEFIRNGLEILPNPTGKFKRDNLVHIYFEIYNLNQDENGRTRYEIEYTAEVETSKRNFLGKLFSRITGKSQNSISIKNTREGTHTTSREYIGLDFSKFEPSVVKLKIKINDLLAKSSTKTETIMELD